MAQVAERKMMEIGPHTLPPLDIHGAFVRRVDLSETSLRNANLSHADASGAIFRGADFAGADLTGTKLLGADLSGAKNLTLAQLRNAIIDDTTILPDYISRQAL